MSSEALHNPTTSRAETEPDEPVESAVQTESAAAGVLLPADSVQIPDVSLVIPTMNEEGGIADCIHRAVSGFSELGMTAEIIVSDSSTDSTPDIARELGATVVTPDGKGYGYAYRYAFAHARADLIAMGDGDMTYDFGELPALVLKLRFTGADMVLGSRLNGEILPGSMPRLHQYIGNPVLTAFLNTFYDAQVSDAHSGMRVFRRDMLDRLDLRCSGMEFASEMIMQASAAGMRIEEVPITYHPRRGEAKLESFRDGWRHVKFMLVNAPAYTFAVPGAALGLAGLSVMFVSLLALVTPWFTFGLHTMVAGSLLTIVGYQIGVLGLFSGVVGTPIRVSRDPITRLIHEDFRAEQGIVGGGLLSLGGLVLAATLLVQWSSSGLVPSVALAMVALTAVVIGIQTVYYSVFFSVLAETRAYRQEDC